MSNKVWDEERIKEEFKKLDSITGLHGADLPITFVKAKHTLGCFYIDTINKKRKKFHFSLFYFGNPEWSETSALDVIRHEYAHYMDYMFNGSSSHGASWKACCRKIGALPSRLYNPKVEEINLHMENKQKEIDSQIESIKQGNMVIHPTYGIGIVNSISDDKRKLYVNFNNEMRCLSAPWVTEHSQIVK